MQTQEEQESKSEYNTAPSDPGNIFYKARCQAAAARSGFSVKGAEKLKLFPYCSYH